MAKAQVQSAKAAAKKRVVKVDSFGDAHITASFNNLIVSLTNKQGQVVSRVLKRILPMQPRWLLQMPPKWLSKQVSRGLTYTLKVRVREGKAPSALYPTQVSKW
jgi:hypothetical protein